MSNRNDQTSPVIRAIDREGSDETALRTLVRHIAKKQESDTEDLRVRMNAIDKKHDKLVGVVAQTQVAVAECNTSIVKVDGKLDKLIAGAHADRQVEASKTERVRMGSRARIVVALCSLGAAVVGVAATLFAQGCV